MRLFIATSPISRLALCRPLAALLTGLLLTTGVAKVQDYPTKPVRVVQIADVPNVLVVHPSVPAKTFEEFLVYLKANPGKLNYGSTGVGTSSHFSSYMLAQWLGVDALHVPYKGANALNDLLAGRL